MNLPAGHIKAAALHVANCHRHCHLETKVVAASPASGCCFIFTCFGVPGPFNTVLTALVYSASRPLWSLPCDPLWPLKYRPLEATAAGQQYVCTSSCSRWLKHVQYRKHAQTNDRMIGQATCNNHPMGVLVHQPMIGTETNHHVLHFLGVHPCHGLGRWRCEVAEVPAHTKEQESGPHRQESTVGSDMRDIHLSICLLKNW